MTTYQFETGLLMAVVAAACAVPGVFLVLRRLVMVGDAVSHVLLPGIVLAFFVVGDLSSPWLLVGAAAGGVLTVYLVELLQRGGRVKQDAAIGLVFPALFSVGTLLASVYLRDTHLDVDRVLLGNAEEAFLSRLTVGGRDCGPKSLVLVAGVFAVTLALLAAFYKELKLATFDAGLATALGFAPAMLHYGLMTCVSLTTVAAFDAVGPVLVLAFFAVPPAAASFFTDRLGRTIVLSVAFAVGGGIGGTALAFALQDFDARIAGTVAGVLGLEFAAAFLLAPRRGLIAGMFRRRRQTREFLETMLAIHLRTHEGTPAEASESSAAELHEHLAWTPAAAAEVAARAERAGLVTRAGEFWKLTPAGRGRADAAFDA